MLAQTVLRAAGRAPSSVFRVAPLKSETTWSLMCRTAARYGQEPGWLLGHWRWGNHQPRHPAGTPRADAEVLLDRNGRALLARLCRVDEEILKQALPSWRHGEEQFTERQRPETAGGLWRVGATVGGPTAFGCRLCVARRSGQAVRAVRYTERWQRVCERHQRWQLDADVDHGLENLDLRGSPEMARAQRQWAGVERRARRAGVEPAEVFALARAVVYRWWEQALGWGEERIWPARLHRLAGGDAGGRFWWWHAVARDAVVFPEVVAVADALLDPAMEELAWADSGREQIRLRSADGAFCRELGLRVGRPWLGPLVAVDYDGPLVADWLGTVVRRRRGVGDPDGRGQDPWWVSRERQPVSTGVQLRLLAEREDGTISWRKAVPDADRARLERLLDEAVQMLGDVHVHDGRPVAEASRNMLRFLVRGSEILDRALLEAAHAALEAGVPPQFVGEWGKIPADLVKEIGRRGPTRDD
ncbi:DNA-binding protein [Streptomyces sp. NBC_00347]|uniref:DNA-binding protein n=1 Tax=Streptomyces sp. NBC_00347 TaxID=2975721 RepID=UPI002254163A|nr:DNA-binding protein [Streptomyces sp. NBC_00347]MCX5130026.1 DNA-binding protein [Streptomyces sp. NBC_00347]